MKSADLKGTGFPWGRPPLFWGRRRLGKFAALRTPWQFFAVMDATRMLAGLALRSVETHFWVGS
jgi:hypothetical protein